VNRFIAQDNEACMFVTTFYGILDIESKEFEYANGGHNSPIIYRHKNGKVEILPRTGGTALGIIEDLKFRVAREELQKGDILFLYTDGIIEAPDKDNQEFGMERLSEILIKNHTLHPEELGKLVADEVHAHAQGLPKFDDLTFLTMKFI
jgi:sigma-B regulation protein RsbU (phosphoserine phosphatase)